MILKPWAQRGGSAHGAHGAQAVAARANRIGAGIKEATVLALNPPPIPGIGTAGGFEFIIEDRSGELELWAWNDVGSALRPVVTPRTEARAA